MTMRLCLTAGAALFIAATVNSAHAEGDARRGGMVYGACAVCHSLQPGTHLTGPSLARLWGRKAGSVSDFLRYSEALRERDFVWDEVTLFAWLADPAAFVPGTSMTFRGIADAAARADLIAFLKIALGANGAAAVVEQKLIPAEVALGQVPEALADTGPETRVTAIRHCRDTFFVVTADGRERPFWELNLRLKVDSGRTGPRGGKPVLLAAGMQGDRASIVFSAARDIAPLVEETCPQR